MIKKELIKDIIKEFSLRLPDKIVQREIEIPVDTQKVISVIGARRAGKTYLMYQAIKKLIETGVELSDILFISCEDERLKLEISEMDLVVQAYAELYPEKDKSKTYWFFDEIQNIDGWERFIRRIYDTITQNIFVSGSNSKLLGTDMATAMRGRTLSIEVFPLSFSEYLDFNKLSKDYYGADNKARILTAQKNYIQTGGFPEIVLMNEKFRINLLQQYYHLMLYNDLIERYKVQNIISLKYLINRILISIGKPYPVNRIYNELKSNGIKVSKNSLYEYLEYIQAVYLVFQLPKYDASFIKQQSAEKKLYFIDTGLLYALSPVPAENTGMVFENIVYGFLRKKYGSFIQNNLFYQKDKTECDFVIFDRNQPTDFIQVSFDISQKETLAREIKGLVNALNYFNKIEGYIITAEQEDEIQIGTKIIYIRPAYKIFINNIIK